MKHILTCPAGGLETPTQVPCTQGLPREHADGMVIDGMVTLMVQWGPWKLGAHWQENDPTELRQVAPFRQGRRIHSLMSAPQLGPYIDLDYTLR